MTTRLHWTPCLCSLRKTKTCPKSAKTWTLTSLCLYRWPFWLFRRSFASRTSPQFRRIEPTRSANSLSKKWASVSSDTIDLAVGSQTMTRPKTMSQWSAEKIMTPTNITKALRLPVVEEVGPDLTVVTRNTQQLISLITSLHWSYKDLQAAGKNLFLRLSFLTSMIETVCELNLIDAKEIETMKCAVVTTMTKTNATAAREN